MGGGERLGKPPGLRLQVLGLGQQEGEVLRIPDTGPSPQLSCLASSARHPSH